MCKMYACGEIITLFLSLSRVIFNSREDDNADAGIEIKLDT